MSNNPTKVNTTNPLNLTADDFTIDANGVIKAEEGLYWKNNPNSKELEKSVDDYRTQYVASFMTAAGTKAIEHMAATPGVESVTMKSDMGRRGLDVTSVVHRESTSRNPRTGETSVINGSASLTVRTAYGKKSGIIKSSAEVLRALATEQFGK